MPRCLFLNPFLTLECGPPRHELPHREPGSACPRRDQLREAACVMQHQLDVCAPFQFARPLGHLAIPHVPKIGMPSPLQFAICVSQQLKRQAAPTARVAEALTDESPCAGFQAKVTSTSRGPTFCARYRTKSHLLLSLVFRDPQQLSPGVHRSSKPARTSDYHPKRCFHR